MKDEQHTNELYLHDPWIKAYQRIGAPVPKGVLVKLRAYLPDQPGSLANFASTIASGSGNIAFFHYDRSIDSSRVAVEVQLDREQQIPPLFEALRDKAASSETPGATRDNVLVTALGNILEVKVRLANEPGTLAAFARLLAAHDANVIYMLYDEDIDAGSADIAIATIDPKEITALLKAINEQGYHYRVVYRGGDEQAVSHIIGLKMVEKFFLRLQKLLASNDVAEIKSLVESSQDLQQDLVQFATEAGNNLEAGDVFETVLTFASRSRSRIGDKFSVAEMPLLRFLDRVDFFGFRLPTSENIYVFRDNDELTMIDAGHGIYYADFKRLLASRGMDPATVRKIYVTHPDTDHVGMAGYFEEEFGTEVFMHAGSADVITNMNRAHGAVGSLLNLNKYYTRLSARFTECRFPAHPRYFPATGGEAMGAFRKISTFSIGPLDFEVLESHGGHTPGLVFYLNKAFGLIFTSDFLLNVKSLTPEDKEHLGMYRYLLTNPNRDSQVYKEETAALREMMLKLDNELQQKGIKAFVFPGHGAYYAASDLNAK